MWNIVKKWAGASMLVSGLSVTGSLAHGQDLQGDLYQYQRDQLQTYRDRQQLNRDLATGNYWGVQRDVRNLQFDRQNLGLDQQNVANDVRFLTNPYPPSYGGYPAPAYGGYPGAGTTYRPACGGYPVQPSYPQASPWGGSSYPGAVPYPPVVRSW